MGIALSAFIDRLVPGEINPHEFYDDKSMDAKNTTISQKTGVITAIATMVHNFPEGFATSIKSANRSRCSGCYRASQHTGGDSGGVAYIMVTKSRKKGVLTLIFFPYLPSRLALWSSFY